MKRVIAGFAGVVLLAACTALQAPPVEQVSTYVLEAMPAAGAPRPKRDLVLEVSAPRARPGFDTPQMAYTQRANALEYFARNRWADTPARMLAPLIAQALNQSGGFRAVVQAPSLAAANLRLDTELVRLQQDFGAKPSRVRLTLRAQLIDVDSRRVLAANRALARLLERLAAFCAEAPIAR